MSQSAGGYEKSDVKARNLFLASIIVIALIVVILVAMNEIFISSREKVVHEVVLSKKSAELRELRAREAEILGNYELLDPQTGRYRIPIERAMEVMAEEAFRENSSR